MTMEYAVGAYKIKIKAICDAIDGIQDTELENLKAHVDAIHDEQRSDCMMCNYQLSQVKPEDKCLTCPGIDLCQTGAGVNRRIITAMRRIYEFCARGTLNNIGCEGFCNEFDNCNGDDVSKCQKALQDCADESRTIMDTF